MNCETACSRDACPKKIIRFRHSDFIERTNRSANAFKFGDRGGRRIRRMPSRSSALRNSSEYFVSRSSIKYRHSRRKPASVSVRLRAIWPHPSTVWVRRDARCGFKRAHLYKLIRDGKFPRPLRIGIRAVGWDSVDIDQWIAEQLQRRT
jgi:prophage regulatory protein